MSDEYADAVMRDTVRLMREVYLFMKDNKDLFPYKMMMPDGSFIDIAGDDFEKWLDAVDLSLLESAVPMGNA